MITVYLLLLYSNHVFKMLCKASGARREDRLKYIFVLTRDYKVTMFFFYFALTLVADALIKKTTLLLLIHKNFFLPTQ